MAVSGLAWVCNTRFVEVAKGLSHHYFESDLLVGVPGYYAMVHGSCG